MIRGLELELEIESGVNSLALPNPSSPSGSALQINTQKPLPPYVNENKMVASKIAPGRTSTVLPRFTTRIVWWLGWERRFLCGAPLLVRLRHHLLVSRFGALDECLALFDHALLLEELLVLCDLVLRAVEGGCVVAVDGRHASHFAVSGSCDGVEW